MSWSILSLIVPATTRFCLLTDVAEIPIILFTRWDASEAVQLGLEYGAIDYIPKDAFADAVLIETLRQMGIVKPEN